MPEKPLRFHCPSCDTPLGVPRAQAGLRLCCYRCGQHVIAPAPAPTSSVPTPCPAGRPTTSPGVRPARASLQAGPRDPEFARWRWWAAQVRDRQGPHRLVSAEDAERAGAVAVLLDGWDAWHARAEAPGGPANLLDGLVAALDALITGLLANGVCPPDALGAPAGGPKDASS